MRRVIIQCEGCEKQYGIGSSVGEQEWGNLANGWFTLHENPRENSYKEDAHFCSVACLKKFFGIGEPLVTQQAPRGAMRRFLLIDGETADEFEAIQFSSGRISVDVAGGDYPPLEFKDWEHLKSSNPGSGITWIDQEVSE